MITSIVPECASIAWRKLLHDLLNHGQVSAPRDLKTIELLGYQSFVDMTRPILLSRERKLSYEFMAAEAWWILSGRNDVEFISKFAPSHARFSDNGTSYFGAYGPRFVEQLPYVVQCLLNDCDSRQAVMTLWRERPPKSKDIPCTVSVQFLLREGLVYCNVNMRSSDAWLGWPYDVFTFSMMAALVAQTLNEAAGLDVWKIGLGTLILTAGSQHLYDKNIQKAKTVAQQVRDLPKCEMKSINPHSALLKHLLRFTGGGLIGAILSEDICLLDALSQAKRSLQD